MMGDHDAAAAALTMPTWLFLLIALVCWGVIIAGFAVVLSVVYDATIGRHFRRKIERIERREQEAAR